MRDGVALAVDVYLPEGAGAVPAVVVRTPYGKNEAEAVEPARRYAGAGLACVVQDCRGRFDSDGEFSPFDEAQDGVDTHDWVAAQDWCDGRVVTAGPSYLGWTQWTAAVQGSKHLVCMAPAAIASGRDRGLLFTGGAFNLAAMAQWAFSVNGRCLNSLRHESWTRTLRHLPVRDLPAAAGRDIPYWRDWLDNRDNRRYWTNRNLDTGVERIAVPALNIGGWYDLFASETVASFVALRERGATRRARASRLIMGPWDHDLSSSKIGDVEFGEAALLDLPAETIGWVERWLGSGTDAETDAPVRLFVMGVNRWREEREWPLARTDWQRWHLRSTGEAAHSLVDGRLTREAPTDAEPVDSFPYDPDHPVPTVGGANLPAVGDDAVATTFGPLDQRDVEMRPDVLCYTSEALTAPLEVTGPVAILLHASTDGPDTDWTAKLVDVHPDGYASILCDGIVRARYCDGDPQGWLEPGTCERYEIEIGVTSNVFLAGHRIRVEVSSSNFPRYERNLNSRGDEPRIASQAVFHSPGRDSHVVLPVIPLR